MWPTLTIPGLGTWPTNGIVRAAYFLFALLLVMHLGRRQGISLSITLRAFAFGVPIAALGARLLDIIEYAERYHSLSDVVGPQGSSAYGALIAVFAFLWVFTRWHGISLLRLLDAGAPAMALGEAMTRIGCFLSGCCYGTPTELPWAVEFPPTSFAFRDQVAHGMLPFSAPQSLPVHPVQLYITLIMLGVTGGLLWWFYRRPPAGRVFFAYLIAYGSVRLAVAPLRAEALGTMKVFSGLFIATGLIGLWAASRHRPAESVAPTTLSTGRRVS